MHKLISGDIMGSIEQQQFGVGFIGNSFCNLGACELFEKNIPYVVFSDLLHQHGQVFGSWFGIRREPLCGQIFQGVAMGQVAECIMASVNDLIVFA